MTPPELMALELDDALATILSLRDAIAAQPIGAFGEGTCAITTDPGGECGELRWPMRDELVSNAGRAYDDLAAACNYVRTSLPALVERVAGLENVIEQLEAQRDAEAEGCERYKAELAECRRDAENQRKALAEISCKSIPIHEWETVGDLEAVPVGYGYSIQTVHGWEQCKKCGLRRHFTRDPNAAIDAAEGRG
jgi:hypothetical protein